MSRVLRGAWSRRGALTTLVLMTAGRRRRRRGGAAVRRGRRHLAVADRAAAPARCGRRAEHRRRARRGPARGDRARPPARDPRPAAVALPAGRAPARDRARHRASASPSARSARSLATRTWLDDAAPALGRPALLAAAGIAGAGLLIVGLSAAAALREPLAVQVSARRRPRRATTLAVFLSVLVLVGCRRRGLPQPGGVRRARPRRAARPRARRSGAGPGRDLGRSGSPPVALTPATEKRGMGAFLAARRLARADDLVTPIRLVVAAAVVGVARPERCGERRAGGPASRPPSRCRAPARSTSPSSVPSAPSTSPSASTPRAST